MNGIIKNGALCFVCVIIVCLFLTGCYIPKDENCQDNIDDRFVVVEQYRYGEDEIRVLVDKNTKIMYLLFTSSYKAGLTVLLDENGNPCKYEIEKE